MDFLEEEIEEILNIFREESEEHIQKINQSLLKLEVNPKDSMVISELFREAHSLKGAARMIGLNDIQALAHKIEDIFGLAKENTLTITAEIVDVLCKSIDCIASIVEESIQTRGARHSVNVDEMIQQLESIKDSVGQNISQPANKQKTGAKKKQIQETEIDESEKKSTEEIKSFYKDCIDLIPQIKEKIIEIRKSSMDTDTISGFYGLVTALDFLAQNISSNEIKEPVQDIKVKLDGVVKGSGILLDAEIDEIEESFNNFLGNLEKAHPESDFENNIPNVQLEKTQEIVKESYIQESQEIPQSQETTISQDIQTTNGQISNDKLESDLTYISQNLHLLSENSENAENTINIIIEKLSNTVSSNTDQTINKILEKILEIFAFSKESGVKPSIEITDVIKQSFDTAQLMLLTSSSNYAEDPDLIIQRLAILLQMLKISDQDTTQNQEEANDAIVVPYSPAGQKNELLPQNEIEKSPNTSPLDNDKSTTNNTTIKTLRVDTKKLDQLVGQVGELIIAKIKTKEHLTEVEKMSRSVEDWYREWQKAKQITKNLDRKPIKPSDLPSGTSIYSQNKNVFSFFEENSVRLTDLMNQINFLYKTIQEDDTRLDLIVNELEEKIKSVRVLPLATIFHMFPRMVRDIAREKGKDIDLIISGSETSVDKKIIEEIKSPLIHIIRNAIDHGIEDPETRTKNGKNPKGKIQLSAYHLENSVLIEAIDDGKGIDLEVIKRKALQKGLLTQAELQAMNDEQIMNIIFWPGFSTGEIVTDISGRGVGLDIVYTKINQLGGKVSIKSILGEGCRVSVQLPVTMATIKAFLVSANNQTFAITTSAIKTALLIKSKDIHYKEGRETIIVDNKTIPICRLSSILEMPDQKLNEEKIVVIVIQAEDVQVGFIIDKLLGDQEILHKNLTPPLLRIRNVAGVTTLGSGELCLILNVNDLIKSAYMNFGMSRKELIINRESSTSIVNRKNILVVDDSVTTRILERNILRAAGYHVTVAINGLDALTKILSEKFDLIISDVEMPEINGFELTERLKKDEKFKHIPLILVTSLASESDKKRGLSLGANSYITKGGFDQEELLATVDKLLSAS
ncbi:MAG: hypothetical protein ACD_20C00157G0019 [uncultured bacterium]|nr:MAG: hypothetical protein ACD_20C00157G0019 [uncultured bacterium]HBH17448.1 hypothetical protein [Cyanobacteria bacterium UBA9579]